MDGIYILLETTKKYFPEIGVIYVDGSYTTVRDLPGDIDVIVELPNPKIEAQIRQSAGQMVERGR